MVGVVRARAGCESCELFRRLGWLCDVIVCMKETLNHYLYTDRRGGGAAERQGGGVAGRQGGGAAGRRRGGKG